MEIKELLKRLENSNEFTGWQEKNKGFYLVHVFYMTGHPPQVGYYSKDTDKVITFDIEDTIVINPPSEVFKNTKTVNELKLDEVNVDKPIIMETVQKFTSDKYPTEKADKKMVLLQEFDGKPIYNVTYFTSSFKTLNVKIDAKTGSVLSDELASLVSF